MTGQRYTQETKQRVVDLRARHFHPEIDEDWTYTAIEEETGVSQERIAAWLDRAGLTGDDEERKIERSIEILDLDTDQDPDVDDDQDDELDEDETDDGGDGDGDQVDEDDHPMPLDEEGAEGFVPDPEEPPPAPSGDQASAEDQEGQESATEATAPPDEESRSTPEPPEDQGPGQASDTAVGERSTSSGGTEEGYVYEAECFNCGGTFGVEEHEIGDTVDCPWECGAQMEAKPPEEADTR